MVNLAQPMAFQTAALAALEHVGARSASGQSQTEQALSEALTGSSGARAPLAVSASGARTAKGGAALASSAEPFDIDDEGGQAVSPHHIVF